MKLAILTRSDFGSPRVLAESLKLQIEKSGNEAEVIYSIDTLTRLFSYSETKDRIKFHYWLRRKIKYYFKDRQILARLKAKDAVVISECIPNAFWKDLYNVGRLKAIINKPILVYEVYSLLNAPTQINKLKSSGEFFPERFDGSLFVSPITEIRARNNANGFCIGLFAKSWNLRPLPKNELIALIDFTQPGFEKYREKQMETLKRVGIKYIALEKRYTIDEIRDIYRAVSIYFIQSFEAFGLPLLECLCTGAQIYTPNSSWPMSWRLDENPEIHGKGVLPSCFTVYEHENDLLEKLLLFKDNFDPVKGPIKVFEEFINNYPFFYYGNDDELRNCLDFVQNKIKKVG